MCCPIGVIFGFEKCLCEAVTRNQEVPSFGLQPGWALRGRASLLSCLTAPQAARPALISGTPGSEAAVRRAPWNGQLVLAHLLSHLLRDSSYNSPASPLSLKGL